MKHLQLQEVVSLENIDRQNNHFFKELTIEIGILRNKLKQNNKLGEKEWQTLAKVVKKYTNMTLKFTNYDSYSVKKALGKLYIYPQYINPNHIFYGDEIRPYLVSYGNDKPVYDKPGGIKGTVSLKTGFVTGEFAKLEAEVNLPGSLLYKDILTDEQAAAIMLHEIGHQFTYYSALDKAVAVNQVMLQLFSNLNKTKDLKERTILIKKASEHMNSTIKIEEATDIASNKDEIAIQMFLVNKAVASRGMTSSSPYYDLTMAEQSADQYVARLGAAVSLAESMDVINKYWDINVYQKNKKEFMRAELYRQISYFASIITAPGKIMSGILTLAAITSAGMTVGAIIGLGVLTIGLAIVDKFVSGAVHGSGINHYNYDGPRDRIVRLKQDLVNQLKEVDKDPGYYRQILIEIESMDNIIKKYYPEDSKLVKWFTGKDDYDSKKIQQELEALAANDLFVHAAHFKY